MKLEDKTNCVRTKEKIQEIEEILRKNLYWHSHINVYHFFDDTRSNFDSLSSLTKRLNAKKV